MLKFFKNYLKLKSDEHEFALGHVDADGKKTLHIFNGEVSPHLEYKGERLKHNVLYRISPVICSTNGVGSHGCTVGNPPEYCLGHCYSENKCAVYSFDEINLDTFHYSLTYEEFQKMNEK